MHSYKNKYFLHIVLGKVQAELSLIFFADFNSLHPKAKQSEHTSIVLW